MLRNVLGVDPGAHGAVAVLTPDGGLIDVFDMPATTETKGRSTTNAPLLAEIFFKSHAGVIFCEFVGSRPTDSKKGAFQFGRARGVIEGVAGALALPVVFLTSPVWKRIASVPPGPDNKDIARTRAIARWPEHAGLFARKADCDRAEAALIGWAGLQRSNTPSHIAADDPEPAFALE